MLVMLLLMYNVSLYGSHQWKSCSFIFWRLSLPFENSIGQGTEWSGCSVPAEFYMVTVLGERSGSSGLQKVADMDSSPRLEALLEWVYQKYYHKIPGQDVVLNEGVCFLSSLTRWWFCPNGRVNLLCLMYGTRKSNQSLFNWPANKSIW